MYIEKLGLAFHLKCFRCSVCSVPLGNGKEGTDVRVSGTNRLHCNNCFSNDLGNHNKNNMMTNINNSFNCNNNKASSSPTSSSSASSSLSSPMQSRSNSNRVVNHHNYVNVNDYVNLNQLFNNNNNNYSKLDELLNNNNNNNSNSNYMSTSTLLSSSINCGGDRSQTTNRAPRVKILDDFLILPNYITAKSGTTTISNNMK